MTHQEQCEAPICQSDTNPNYKKEVLWYAGEKVCQKTPFQKFQKKQAMINRELGTFRHKDKPYTAYDLENRSV